MTKENKSTLLKRRVTSLIRRLEIDTSESRQIRSYLKRSPIELASAPDVWEFVYRGSAEDDVFSDKEYQAIYTALRFYAFHRSVNNNANRFKSDGGKSIAELLAIYRKSSGGHNIDPKVAAVLTTTDSLRLVRLLEALFRRATKETKVALDYADFAYELNLLQYPNSAKKVMLSWGKNYYKNTFEKTETKEKN